MGRTLPGSDFFSSPAGRKFLFAALYFSEGAPIGFIWWALPTRLRAADIPVEEITALTAVLVLPWVFKFAWAPLVDVLRTHRWNLPEWIVASQILMGLCLLPLAFLDFHEYYSLIVPLLILHAITAATQDASIDALSIATVPSTERGSLNGWMQTGMLGGRALFGGGALLAAEWIGEGGVIILLVGAIWFSMALVIAAKPDLHIPQTSERFAERRTSFLINLREVVAHKSTWVGLLFAGVAGAGFEAVGAVAGPFLVDRGFSIAEVGWFFGIPVVAGMVAGALLGGYASDRFGRIRAVMIFLVAIAACIFTLSLFDAATNGSGGWEYVVLLSLLYVCIGMFTAASYALFMDITDVRLGATQFSTYMGATNGCESWATLVVGRMIPAFGYPIAFAVMAAISLLTIPLVRTLRPRDT
ncbi:MAG: MFS transporter [Bacteroidetes bacterium]|nr:MFS transporter [Bacteroidota bacterium]MCW5894187.1 MFS transporter [Bacteroidota bacterium]